MTLKQSFLCLLLGALLVVSCRERSHKVPLTRDSFADMCDSRLHLSEKKIRKHVADLMFEDKDMQAADIQLKRYYQAHGDFLWIGRGGVRADADSVVKYVARVTEMGFSADRFRVDDIRDDIQRVRRLEFGDDGIDLVFARLEYNLTKAFLRYCVGQRCGFVNPRKLFNRLDVHDSDSVHVTYQTLFDIPVKNPDKNFCKMAFGKIRHDSVGVFLRESEPADPFYRELLARLHSETTEAGRMRVMCNMERCRWAAGRYPAKEDKYVLLNVASQELDAVDGDKRLSMRVVCGATKTKTPLLYSRIERIDINPQWIIPKSIVKKSVVPHAGSTAYFDSRRYFVLERKTGKTVDAALTTPQMLMSHDYLVIQKGGKGNSLGRMIFRFDNKFSVYLHDTSNPKLFTSTDRMASHGCVRVQRPLDLAMFLLGDADERLKEKVRYSFTVDLEAESTADGTEGGRNGAASVDKSKLVRSVPVKAKVPLFITYFTLYKTADGSMRSYPDIYGYDKVLAQALKRYM